MTLTHGAPKSMINTLNSSSARLSMQQCFGSLQTAPVAPRRQSLHSIPRHISTASGLQQWYTDDRRRLLQGIAAGILGAAVMGRGSTALAASKNVSQVGDSNLDHRKCSCMHTFNCAETAWVTQVSSSWAPFVLFPLFHRMNRLPGTRPAATCSLDHRKCRCMHTANCAESACDSGIVMSRPCRAIFVRSLS